MWLRCDLLNHKRMGLKTPLKNHFSASESASSIVASFVESIFLPLGPKYPRHKKRIRNHVWGKQDLKPHEDVPKKISRTVFHLVLRRRSHLDFQRKVRTSLLAVFCRLFPHSLNPLQQQTEHRTSVSPGFSVERHLIVELEKSGLW